MSKMAWLLAPYLAFAACADEPEANHEPVAATHDASLGEQESQTPDVTQSPTDIEPTTVMLKFGGDEQDSAVMSPASARLDLDLDGHAVFSAYAKVSDEALSLRLAIVNKDEPLQGQTFELEQGVEQTNQISLIQGDLPNATTWRSVDGTAVFESFGKQSFELTFDVGLSRDPRGRGATTKISGNFRGGALFVCQGLAVQSAQAGAQSSDGQTRAVAGLSDKECRALLAKLVSD